MLEFCGVKRPRKSAQLIVRRCSVMERPGTRDTVPSFVAQDDKLPSARSWESLAVGRRHRLDDLLDPVTPSLVRPVFTHRWGKNSVACRKSGVPCRVGCGHATMAVLAEREYAAPHRLKIAQTVSTL